jgi:hypothetical protein
MKWWNSEKEKRNYIYTIGSRIYEKVQYFSIHNLSHPFFMHEGTFAAGCGEDRM